MKYRSTSPTPPRPVERLSSLRDEMGYLSDTEILVQGPETVIKCGRITCSYEEEEGPAGVGKPDYVTYYWFKFNAADLITPEEKAKSYPEPSGSYSYSPFSSYEKTKSPTLSLSKAEGPPTLSFSKAEAPKPAAYYWLKLKLGQPLTSAEKAKASSYNLEYLLGDNLLFCTICGDEDHWVYNCDKYYEEYKCPYGTEYIPPGITQHDDKPENPSDVWTDSDEDYLQSISGKFYYLLGLSELKNIHRIMIDQHNDIKAVVNSGIQPKYAVRKTSGEYDHQASGEESAIEGQPPTEMCGNNRTTS